MGIKLNLTQVTDDVFSCENAKSGLYRSKKGSLLIKPEANLTNRGNVGGQSDHVLITDIDTGRTIIKRCDDVKGSYKFVCDLDCIEMSVNADGDVDGDCGCGDGW